MADLNDAVTLADGAVISWAAVAAGVEVDNLVNDYDREKLHELLTAFGKVCQAL